MIIGQGLIANVFKSYLENNAVVIFASGVSNSGEIRQEPYEREKKLLADTLNGISQETIVYFSTCSVLVKESRYTKHKLEMEHLIHASDKRHNIIRTTNIVGPSSNPNTLLNFITNRIKTGQMFDLQYQTYRNLLDVQDLEVIVSAILRQPRTSQSIFQVGYPYSYKMTEIVSDIEDFYHLKAHTNLIESKKELIDSFYPLHLIQEFKVMPKDQYLKNMLCKYYPMISN